VDANPAGVGAESLTEGAVVERSPRLPVTCVVDGTSGSSGAWSSNRLLQGFGAHAEVGSISMRTMAGSQLYIPWETPDLRHQGRSW
jgi:hypothetical protein